MPDQPDVLGQLYTRGVAGVETREHLLEMKQLLASATAERDALRAENERLREALARSGAVLEALNVGVQWELAPSVKSEIRDALRFVRQALSTPQPDPQPDPQPEQRQPLPPALLLREAGAKPLEGFE